MAISAEIKVGVVFFIGVCILVLFTLIFTDIHLFRKYYTLDVLFDSVGGLEKGDKVTLGGMEVGDVKDLTMEENIIRVRLAIRSEIKIPATSIIKVVDVGLLGGKRVDIVWQEPTSEFFGPGMEIRGESSPGLSGALERLGESGEKVEEILTSTKQIADKIARGEGTIGKLVSEDTMYQDAQKFFAELRQLIEENRAKVSGMVDELREAAPKLKRTLGNLEEITAQINRGEGALGRLVKDEEIYEQVNQTLSSVKTASQKLTDLASRAERVRFYIGAETTYNIDTKKYLSKTFIKIEPTSSKLYQVGVSILSGPGTEASTTDEPDVELDAQIGLRFFDDRLTVRAGLLEGRVGGGFDFRIWEERLVATVEGRSVWTKEKDEGIEPFLLRARLTADLFWGFYVHIGGDNLLDDAAFSAGAGLKIRDDDIKSLFGIVSLAQ